MENTVLNKLVYQVIRMKFLPRYENQVFFKEEKMQVTLRRGYRPSETINPSFEKY